MKHKFTYKRLLAGLLCITLTVGFVPAGVSAEEDTTQETTEVVSLREENVKHFDMGNGTYQAIAYSHPIHEKDEDGNWQDIDFSMDLTRQNGTRVYANEAGGTAFAASYTANEPIMTLGDEGSSISMTLVTDTPSTWSLFGSSVAAEVTGAEVDIQTVADAQNANFSNTLLYEEVMPGVDLEYIVDPWCVKENIIVNQPGESYFYRFLLEIDGMYPVMQEDGSILIYSEETDEPEYEIPAPYMYDADGEISFDVFYTLETSGGNYYLTVFANVDWINAEERIFPVTIDPSYVSSPAVASQDTYINGSAADDTRGSYNFFYVGGNEVSYIDVPTPFLPAGTVLYWADLSMYYFFKDKVKSGSVGVTAHKVNFPWDEDTLTWNSVVSNYAFFGMEKDVLGSQNQNNGIIETRGDVGAYPNSPVSVVFDITEAAWSWLDGSSPNYGIGLQYVTTSSNKSVMFRSTEYSAYYSPKLTYYYGPAATSSYTYTSFYDNSLTDTQKNLISSVIANVNKVYNNQFGITLTANGSPSYKKTSIDDCTLGKDEWCEDDTCGTAHHKDMYKIANDLYSESRSANEITVLWTDHIGLAYCSHESGSCVNRVGPMAIVYKHRPVIHILDLVADSGSSAEYRACMTILLIHETAHAFGLEDAYDDATHTVGDWPCVLASYDSDKENVLAFYDRVVNKNENAFCDSCARKLSHMIKRGLYDNFYDCD